jgi:hypothetical protein
LDSNINTIDLKYKLLILTFLEFYNINVPRYMFKL